MYDIVLGAIFQNYKAPRRK